MTALGGASDERTPVPITKHLLGLDVPFRPAGVSDCVAYPANGSDRCGWRCARWAHALGANSDRSGDAEWRLTVRKTAIYYQLCAELCEAAPDPLREVVRDALWDARGSDVDDLVQLGKRARFLLTTADPVQQRFAATLLADFTGDWRQFERTVKAAAA
jgi:hypothetical protein